MSTAPVELAELLGDPLDLTFLRMTMSSRTGRITKRTRTNHCVYAAQLAELVLSGHLIEVNGRPKVAQPASPWPTRLQGVRDRLRGTPGQSWDELMWREPRLVVTACQLATAELVSRGLWRRRSALSGSRRLMPAFGRYWQFYPGEAEQIAALLDPGLVEVGSAPSAQDLRRAFLIALGQIHGGESGTQIFARGAMSPEIGDELQGQWHALMSLVKATEVALVVSTARWAAPEMLID